MADWVFEPAKYRTCGGVPFDEGFKSSDKKVATLPIRGIKLSKDSTKGGVGKDPFLGMKLTAEDPFLKSTLRKAAFNYVKDNCTKKPSEACTAELEQITNGTLRYEDAPAVFYDETSLALPRFSHLYSLKPYPKSLKMWDVINQIRQMLMDKFPSESLPMVYVYRYEGEQGKPLAILLQCLDSESHLCLEAEGADLKFGKVAEGVNKGSVFTMTLKHSGLRVDSCICTVVFSADYAPSQAMLPVDHEVALRVAKSYAKMCGSAAPIQEYPDAPNGLLQVWRDTFTEYNLIKGSKVVSDLNDFQMSFWIPNQEARKNLKSTLTDEVSGQKFRFDFPYRRLKDANNGKEEIKGGQALIGWHSPQESQSKWPSQYTRYTF